MDLISTVGLRQEDAYVRTAVALRRNGPDQYGGIATTAHSQLVILIAHLVGMDLISTVGLRHGGGGDEDGEGDVGMDLISTVGLRRLLLDLFFAVHQEGRNGPDQYGGIATVVDASVGSIQQWSEWT